MLMSSKFLIVKTIDIIRSGWIKLKTLSFKRKHDALIQICSDVRNSIFRTTPNQFPETGKITFGVFIVGSKLL